MSRSQRPGGLTALGFIHFLMATSYALGVVVLLFELAQGASFAKYGSTGRAIMFGVMNGVMAFLLLVNGIGLLRISRLLGLLLTPALALVSLVQAGMMIQLAPDEFEISNVAGLTYAWMATVLTWTVFRRDFAARKSDS